MISAVVCLVALVSAVLVNLLPGFFAPHHDATGIIVAVKQVVAVAGVEGKSGSHRCCAVKLCSSTYALTF